MALSTSLADMSFGNRSLVPFGLLSRCVANTRDRNFFTPSQWPCTAGDLVGVGDRQLGAPLGQLPVGDVGDDRDDACLEGLLVVPPAAPLAATEMALVVAQLVHDLGHNGSCGGAAGRR